MKLKMELKPGDIVLLKVLACVLIIFFIGRFLILPGIETHQDLSAKKTDLEVQQQEMQYTIDNVGTVEQKIEAQKEALQESLKGYYELMENREVDELVTGIVLKHDLFPTYLSIAETTPGIPNAYFLADQTTTASTEEEKSVSEQNAANKQSADEELDGTSSGSDGSDSSNGSGSSDTDSSDAAASGSTQALQYVNATAVSLTIQGSEANIQEMLDDIAKNYPGIQVSSLTMQENTYVDQSLQSVSEMNCSCIFTVYTCGELG